MTSPGQPPPDAADYPGGAAGVLEDKQHRGDLLHLGELAASLCRTSGFTPVHGIEALILPLYQAGT